MAEKRPGFLRRLIGGLWNGLDFTRRLVVNLVFLLILIFVVMAIFGGGDRDLQKNTTLVLDIKGEIVEQYSGSPADVALAKALGDEVPETQLRDLLKALDEAAKDDNISQILLSLNNYGGAGVSTLREVGRALDAFRKSGKKVVAHGDYLDQGAYYLASHADEIYIHPDGMALLEGLGRYRNYYRSALEKIGLQMHVFRVGKFKSAVEPYLLDGPSDAAREADRYWLEDVWTVFLDDIAAARGLETAELRAMIDELPQRITAVNGDMAKLAVDEKLVDGLKTADEIREMLIASGAKDDDKETFRQVNLAAYLKRFPAIPVIGDATQIGVIVAQGEIVGGQQAQGMIGGRSTSELVRKAREDKNIKAVVLRVDSPGGSGFDSELIRRELELTRAAGKPVVVSMGDVAASGGYWISMTSDAIYAEPSTITGSIGIFGLFPDASQTMEKLGLHSEGTTTTWLAGALDPRRPLDPRIGDVLQSVINAGYQDFIGKVAKNRGKTPEEIDEIAQGRVWSGNQALERGLVDQLGGLKDAIANAAERANLGSDGYQVVYVEKELTGFEKFMVSMNSRARAMIQSSVASALLPSWLQPQMARELNHDLAILNGWEKRPMATYAFCFCELR
ncbi:MAG: signal peptide peptidase SppA [Lysobacterales bacterium]|nr:signal peptide peptidase SppA [Xanthomonadales bacterium]MCB1612603.1 signal peptide peptidase SppA [Xanthomonadales bacterium]MCP5473762.1 signal peptide peptidase SppA [Rhodanobacteraceae bacterium]